MPNPKLETYKSKKTGVIYDYTDADAQSQLTGIKDGTSIDSFADVESALAGKASASDVASRVDWSSYAKTGAYNLFPFPYSHSSQSSDNTTFTVNNDDGTITIVANNPSANADFYIQGNSYADAPNKFMANGQYAFSCEGLSNNVKMYFGKQSTSAYYNFSDTDTHTIASSDSNPLQYCFIRVVAGATVNVTLKPLITLPNATSRTFVPPAMTNRELTDKKVDKLAKVLTSSDDLDNIVKTGFYYATTAPTHSPIAAGYYALIVMARNSTDAKQMVFFGNKIYGRALGGNPAAWSSWYEYSGIIVS